MAATIPADILQFFGMSLRLAQELSYLYGAEDLWVDSKVDDEKVQNQLLLYCGVMFGVSGAISGVRVLTTQVSKNVLKQLPKKALTKTFWYPILKKIAKAVFGKSVTKASFAKGVSKVVPVIGGLVSGGINFASMMPMANRLNDTLDKAIFDYSDEEFNFDIETIMNVSLDEENEDKEKNESELKEKMEKGFNSAKEGFNNLISKFNKKDPYEELKKLKELLDNNIISEEEFNKKKKELLNL